MEQWTFTAVDSWFFRESRPMEAVGASRLDSVFPPPANTVIGAIRHCIGEAHQVDWREYASGPHALHQVMGTPADLGPLSFDGPYLLHNDKQRLYPMPQSLLWTADRQHTTRLLPGAMPVECDLGRVRLPQKHTPLAGASAKADTWLTEQGLCAFLRGQPVLPDDMVQPNSLFVSEERLGIARDHARRVADDGLLYQTKHIRPQPGCAIAMNVGGLNDSRLAQTGLCRLGAEGRLAGWQRNPALTLPDISSPAQKNGLMLMLLTPALFTQGWVPDGLQETEQDGCRVWQGVLHGVALTLVCAALGKPRREGGWDLVNKKPRDLHSFIPAGCVFFCEAQGNLEAAQRALHGKQIGLEHAWGRGKIAAGFY